MSLDDVTEQELEELELLIESEMAWQRENRIHAMYEPGPLGIDKYPKHAECFRDGKDYRTRCFMGGNGTGKTYGVGAFELVLHLTGDYPAWWDGLVFDHPINAWCAADTRETVRDTIQKYLLGDVPEMGRDALGTGMIPRSKIGRVKFVNGTNDSCDIVTVKHSSGGWSQLGFKSYDQGRKKFQGTNKHFILLDEEPPTGIYEECLQRGRGCDGRLLMTYTPLSGWTYVVDQMMGWEELNKKGASIKTVHCDWDDVPHLDEEWKRNQLAQTRPHMRKARKAGIPNAGIGMVYPMEEEDYVIKPVPLPAHWRRCFGFDGGFHNTAAVWIAWDKDEDVAYVYADYKRGEVSTEAHAIALMARGDWIPGVGDAASLANPGSGKAEKLIQTYKALGVDMVLPDKSSGSVDAGIQEVYSRLNSGRLKVFNTCQKLLAEIRRYRYNEKQQIVKENDHIMDALRYAIADGLKRATTQRVRASDINENLRFG